MGKVKDKPKGRDAARVPHSKVKASKATKAGGRQFAVLPYRMTEEGLPEVLLIVSRETRRWVIPKGWPMEGRKPHEAAAREAFEEAGIIGMPSPRPIGCYGYDKRLDARRAVPCEVTVYPFAFLEQRKRWPERKERGQGRWMAPEEAAGAVDEPGLSEIIRAFGRALVPDGDIQAPRP